MKEFLQSLKDWIKEYGLEALLFFIAIGNADVLHHYLVKTGSTDTWQLIIAVYATEMLVVWASLWRTIGLFISFVLFMVSMVSISSVFGSEWLGHSGFSLAIFCGSLGNYVRRNAWLELLEIYNFFKGKATKTVTAIGLDLTGMTTAEIRTKLSISLTHANLIKEMRDKGIVITDRLVEETKC
jgi:hypothetical protein